MTEGDDIDRLEMRLAERTLQLELVLEVLRSRDQAAAEQAEWDFATELQVSGLPQGFPPYPDRPEFDLHAGMVTAKEVGGDLYDFFLLGPDRLGFVVADAAGKGLPAAIFITLVRTLLKAAAARLANPGDCLRMVNALVSLDNPTLMFATAFYGTLDLADGTVLWANAGHNPPYVLRADGAVEIVPGTGSMALGIGEEAEFPTRRLVLAPADVLVCFTDGVTDAVDPAGELFGTARLTRLLAEQPDRHPTAILGNLIAGIDHHMSVAEMADDVTVLTLRYNG
jgi:sigma-B regulation protein RsbU (phosphoserine phosphatase)